MTRQSVNIFGYTPVVPSAKAPIQNKEGYPAWERSLEEQTVQVLVCNTFGQTFYSSQAEVLKNTEEIFDKMLAKDSVFFAKALVYGREKGFMRTSPILGLVKLFGVNTEAAKQVFNKVIRTPNDLADFTAILKSKRNGEGGRAVKTAAGNWMINRLGEYQVVKYGAEKGEGSYSLKDMVQVYHPKGNKSDRPLFMGALFDYILGGKRINAKGERSMNEFNFKKLIDKDKHVSVLEQFELLKRATDDDQKVEAITLGGLPHEVTTSFASSKKVWNAIVPNMPVFALLRNLATLERHGVLEENKKFIQSTFSNKEIIQKSMILPFRFLEADKHVTTGWVKDSLRDGLELSFANLPEINGKTAVMLDVSGSMEAPVSQQTMVTRVMIGAIFGICLVKKAGDGKLITFDTSARDVPVSMRDSILTQAGNIRASGGTDHSVAINLLMKTGGKVDQIIYITDEQQNAGTPLIDKIAEYRKSVNKNVKLFIVDLSTDRGSLAPTDPNTFYMYGWSDSALQFISQASNGFGGLVETINKIEL